MEQNYDKKYWDTKKCPKVDCRKDSCKCGLEKVFLATILGDDSKDSPIAPKNGDYCNALVVYEANGHIYIYSKEGIPTLVYSGDSDADVDEILEKIEKEIFDRQAADNVLQGEIDDIKNSPDVVDIVATYAALQAYDTSKLGDNDVVRVLADEQHDGQSTYYRWNKQSSTWTYIGAVGDYYTKGQVDDLLDDKQDTLTAGRRITIDSDNEISADGLITLSYGNSTWNDFITAYNNNEVVYCRASSGQDPSQGAQTRLAFMAYVNNAANPTEVEFQYVRSVTSKSASNQTDQVFVYTLANSGTWTVETRPVAVKIVAGTNMSSSYSGNALTLSATDTTYTHFTGATASTDGTQGLVPAPIAGDENKFLKADGTWDTAGGGGPTVVQTTGTSQTDVMSQNATSSMVFQDPTTKRTIQIGDGAASAAYTESISIGRNSKANGSESVCIGKGAGLNTPNTVSQFVAIGPGAGMDMANAVGSVSLGAQSKATRQGEVNIGSTTTDYGYNSTNYRVLGGVHDAVDGHDATTLNQLDGRVKQNAGAPTTSTVGTVGQLLEDTTNGKLYQCTAIDTTDPQNPSYTWSEVGAGGSGPTVVQTTGTSTTDVMSQNAVTSMVFDDPSARERVKIGLGAGTRTGSRNVAIGYYTIAGNTSNANNCTAVGSQAYAPRMNSTAIGQSANAEGSESTAVGYSATVVGTASNSVAIGRGTRVDANVQYSVSLGNYARATRSGELNVGTHTNNYGYNSTPYRVIGGVYDGQDIHDAATVAQGNTLATSAPDTSTVGVLGQLWTDTTNMHTYQCTAISGSTYTWQMRW